MLQTLHGDITFPIFLPDATYGVVRSVDSDDLTNVGVRALVMNVFHLMQRPGSSTIQSLGGMHRMYDWNGPIVTDSGGFQAYSLIRQNAKYGSLSDQGITFQPENADRKFQLTPEKSVQLQLAYGADIVICLDDCTHVDAADADQQQSVRRTVRWAKRCKAEFELQLKQRRIRESDVRPLLFAVVQGGGSKDLRRACAEALLEIGFDGYGFGGWPLDSSGHLLSDILTYTRECIPAEFPMHALGVGQPENVVNCAKMGYQMFDSALPTRDARSGRLYVYASDPHHAHFRPDGFWYSYLYIDDKKHIKEEAPISPGCDCLTCRKYSVSYLHHLYQMKETLFFRLATIHNLRFMMQLMELLA